MPTGLCLDLHHPWEFTHNLGDLKLGEEYEQWRYHIKQPKREDA